MYRLSSDALIIETGYSCSKYKHITLGIYFFNHAWQFRGRVSRTNRMGFTVFKLHFTWYRFVILTKQESHRSMPRTNDQLNNKFEIRDIFAAVSLERVSSYCRRVLVMKPNTKVFVMMQELYWHSVPSRRNSQYDILLNNRAVEYNNEKQSPNCISAKHHGRLNFDVFFGILLICKR